MGGAMFKKLSFTAFVVILMAISFASSAQNIDTTPSWDGTNNICCFAYPDSATYGQTITAPAAGATLQSFTFYMNLPASCTFQGEVYAWDGAKASGSALWEGPPTQTTGSGTYEAITFTPGGISLAPGAQYVIFASLSKLSGSGGGNWGSILTDVYAGGDFVYINSGNDPSQWTSAPWTITWPSAIDLAFKVVFGSGQTPASPPGLTVTSVSVCAGATVVPLSIDPTLTVTDGSEVLGNLLISGVPAGATLSAGTDQGSGTWLLTPAQLAELTINLPAGATSFTLSVQASEDKQTVLLPAADSYVDSWSPDSNFGTQSFLEVFRDYSGRTWDTYVRFDLSSLPSPTVLANSAFSIIFYNGYAYDGDWADHLYFVPDDTWTETGITWNNRPAYNTPELGSWVVWNDNTPRYWIFLTDVTSTVATEYAGDKQVSFAIHNPGIYSAFYYSRETGATNSPKLIVNHDPAYTTDDLSVTLVSPVISPSTLPSGVVGATYNQTLAVNGGVPPYAWSISGTTIPGVTLTPSASPSLTATLSGTIAASGPFDFVVTATDSNGCQGSQEYTGVISQTNLSFMDDYGRSQLCVNGFTGAWQWTVFKGNGAGNVYSGTGTLVNGSGYMRLTATAGSGYSLSLIYYTTAHRATATFSYRPDAVSSTLYDANTLDDPACGGATD